MAHTRHFPTDALSILSQPGTPLAAMLAVRFALVVTTWATRRRTRIDLANLDARMLRDVGLTAEQAGTEASRLFWQA